MKTLSNLTAFPAELYRKPNSGNRFNMIHHCMQRNLGLGETITAADPEQREWLLLLSFARHLVDTNSYFGKLDEYLDPIARVPLHCMPAMLWLHKEDPASYQWILKNLDESFGLSATIEEVMHAMHLPRSWSSWLLWAAAPQGDSHWRDLHTDYLRSKS